MFSCIVVKQSESWFGRKGYRKKERKHEIKLHLRKALFCEKLKAKKAGVAFFVVSSKKAVRKMIWKKGRQKERKKK